MGVLFALWAKLWIFQLIQGFKGCFAISASDLNSASENRPNNAFFLRLHVLPFYICLFEIWRLLFHLYSSYTCVFSCPNCRYDQRGYALTSQSLSETKSGGSGTRMNWKTLSDVKKENLGHGEKVQNTYILCQPAHTWESVWELSTCSRSHRNVKKNLICRDGGGVGGFVSLRWFFMDSATGARLMWESGNPLSLAAGHCWLIEESTHRWNSNSTTDFDREKSLRWSRKRKSTRVCCQLLRISEVECQQNSAITQGPVHHVYRQLMLQIGLSTLTSCHFTSATNSKAPLTVSSSVSS